MRNISIPTGESGPGSSSTLHLASGIRARQTSPLSHALPAKDQGPAATYAAATYQKPSSSLTGALPIVAQENQPPLRILVAEDNKVNQKVVLKVR